MEPAQNNQAAQAAAPGQVPQQSMWDIFKSIAGRMLMMYLIMNGMSFFRGNQNKSQNSTSDPNAPVSNELSGNIFPRGSRFVSCLNGNLIL